MNNNTEEELIRLIDQGLYRAYHLQQDRNSPESFDYYRGQEQAYKEIKEFIQNNQTCI